MAPVGRVVCCRIRWRLRRFIAQNRFNFVGVMIHCAGPPRKSFFPVNASHLLSLYIWRLQGCDGDLGPHDRIARHRLLKGVIWRDRGDSTPPEIYWFRCRCCKLASRQIPRHAPAWEYPDHLNWVVTRRTQGSLLHYFYSRQRSGSKGRRKCQRGRLLAELPSIQMMMFTRPMQDSQESTERHLDSSGNRGLKFGNASRHKSVITWLVPV